MPVTVVTAVVLCGVGTATAAAASVVYTDVMQGATLRSNGTTGNHSYRGFRIPGFMAIKGRLLVFAEGRTR